MKYLLNLLSVIFFCFICSSSFSEQKIAFIDMKFILNESKAGKSAQVFLQNKVKKNQDKFAKMEESLKKEEIDLLSNKSKVSKEDYKNKSDKLRKKVAQYQNDRRSALNDIAKLRNHARVLLLEKLNPILEKYILKNNISLIVNRANVVIGIKELDITKEITEQFNKEVLSLKLK